jgi:hypothetical protein
MLDDVQKPRQRPMKSALQEAFHTTLMTSPTRCHGKPRTSASSCCGFRRNETLISVELERCVGVPALV